MILLEKKSSIQRFKRVVHGALELRLGLRSKYLRLMLRLMDGNLRSNGNSDRNK